MALRITLFSTPLLAVALLLPSLAIAGPRSAEGEKVIVDAPTTRVEADRRGKVAVDAPYANVRRDTRGVHVRAPFVDLYIPRRGRD